jgi:hypothetical protein
MQGFHASGEKVDDRWPVFLVSISCGQVQGNPAGNAVIKPQPVKGDAGFVLNFLTLRV